MPSSVVPTFRKPRKVGQPICGGASEKLKARQPPLFREPTLYGVTVIVIEFDFTIPCSL